MRRLSAAAIVLLACGVPVMAGTQIGKLGGEFQVNTFTSGDQENAHVATDANGNFVVVWTSQFADGSNDAAAVQRYSANGTRLGTEFFANTFTSGDQSVPDVAVQPNGDFVVVWQSDNNQDGDYDGIFGQRFSSTGAAVGTEFQVNTFTSNSQEVPAVAIDPAGDFVVAWESRDQGCSGGYCSGIFGQRFASSGAPVGTEFQVNTFTSSEKEKPAVAMDATGNFIVVWESHYSDGSSEGVAAQRYDNTGAPVGTEFQVNTYTTDAQEHVSVAMGAAGNFVVVWDSYGQDGSAEGIFGQRFDSSGAKVGTEFQANTYTTNEQEDPSVALDAAGNFVVTWYSGYYGPSYPLSQDHSGDGAFGQRFSSTGARLGTEFQINTFTSGNQTDPKVAVQPGGKFVVVWYSESSANEAPVGDGDSVHAQRFGPVTGQVAPALGSTGLVLLAVGLLLIGATTLARRRQRRA